MFVFAFTQVTTMLAHDATWRGLGRGLLIAAALWWAWSGYAWLTNTVHSEEGAVDAAMLDPDLVRAILRLAAYALVGTGLILVAGFVHGELKPLLWLAALAIAYFGPMVGGMSGWRIHPAHFVERHELIVIIALGESLVAIGVAATGTGIELGAIVATGLGLAIAVAFWLAHFDFFSIRARQLLWERRGTARAILARDAFTYLHLPMVTGIAGLGFGIWLLAKG